MELLYDMYDECRGLHGLAGVYHGMAFLEYIFMPN